MKPGSSTKRSLACMAVLAAAALTGSVLTDGPAAASMSPAAQARAEYARLTPAQRIGQLFMAAYPATGRTAAARASLARWHAGNVILVGHSAAGVTAMATRVGSARRLTTYDRARPFVAVDQEGGYVQHLTGPGFSTIPTALRQGRLSTTTLRARWRQWGAQLRRAGVNLDLAPVADVVPASIGTANQPIGRYYREYGHTASGVSADVAAVVQGIKAAGVGATAKHFPGLGRASGNTDTKAGVTDPTTRTDTYLRPFRSAISAGVPVVMVSTAIYPHIDPGTVAVFSHTVVTDMLRGDLGFSGLVISDSLDTVSLQRYDPGRRAIRALRAGVDVLLVTSASALGPMADAVIRRSRSSATFAAVVRAAVLHVLTAKAKAGLLTSA